MGEREAGNRAYVLVLGVTLACLLVFWLRAGAGSSVDGIGIEARRHLDVIAQQPRPVGSPWHDQVRTYLLDAIAREHWEIEVQQAERAGYAIQNVLAKKRGSASTGVLLFMAHYDTKPDSPGTSDDGLGVATLLELADSLNEATLRNDVILLFTDGEELDRYGSAAFLEEHRWASDVRCALNFDSLGNHGPLLLFEFGPRSGLLYERYAASVHGGFGSALAQAIYGSFPNSTDFTEFKRADVPGLNFAFVGGSSLYHSPKDGLEALNPAGVERMAELQRALAQALGDADLRALASEVPGFFDVLGLFLVPTPAAVTWILLAAAFLLAGRALLRREGAGVARHVARVCIQASGYVGLALALAAVCLLAGRALRAAGTALLAPTVDRGSFWSVFVALAALVAFVLFLGGWGISRLRVRGWSPARLASGPLLVWVLVLLYFSIQDVRATPPLALALVTAVLSSLCLERGARVSRSLGIALSLLPLPLLISTLGSACLSVSVELHVSLFVGIMSLALGYALLVPLMSSVPLPGRSVRWTFAVLASVGLVCAYVLRIRGF